MLLIRNIIITVTLPCILQSPTLLYLQQFSECIKKLGKFSTHFWPTKTPETLRFFGVSRWCKMRKLPRNRLNSTIIFSNSEAVAGKCSIKKMFLKISLNSQENVCVRVSEKKKTLWHRCFFKFCELFKNTFFYRTLPVSAFDNFSQIKQYTNNTKYCFIFCL